MRLINDDCGFNVGMMVRRTDFLQGCPLLLSSGVFRCASVLGLLDLQRTSSPDVLERKVAIALHMTLWLWIHALPLRVCIKPLLPS